MPGGTRAHPLWTGAALWANTRPMAHKKKSELWPSWSNWALLGVLATILLTIAATLNDIF